MNKGSDDMPKKKNESENIQSEIENEVVDSQGSEEISPAEQEETTENTQKEQASDVDKAKEWEDKYMRLYAEFDNYKKRSEKEKASRYADAVVDTVASFLPVVDNIERALSTEVSSDDAKQLYEGVSLVKKQIDESLKNLNVKKMETVGEEFDPNLHNAVMHIEDDSIDDNTIVEELMKGYIYADNRVVRHPMVKVAN